MSESLSSPRPRGQALLAWVVILAVCGFIFWRNFIAEAQVVLPKPAIDSKKPNPVVLLAGAFMLLTAVTGLFLLIAWFVLLFVGKLRLRMHTYPHHGAIYAETFALWLVLFVGLQFTLPLIPAGRSQLLLSGLAMILSLAALAWPILRGVGWTRLRSDLGLHPGRNVGVELLCGLACYAAALAMAVAGMLVIFGLMALRRKLAPGAPETTPSHPAAERIIYGDWWTRLQVLFAAVVAAPLVEEILFRGVLYRHLREATHRWGKLLSILAAALGTSFVFAAIHPQGWLGIPLLMGLALVFALTREWRGTLLPSMVAHAVNNAVVTSIVIAVYG